MGSVDWFGPLEFFNKVGWAPELPPLEVHKASKGAVATTCCHFLKVEKGKLRDPPVRSVRVVWVKQGFPIYPRHRVQLQTIMATGIHSTKHFWSNWWEAKPPRPPKGAAAFFPSQQLPVICNAAEVIYIDIYTLHGALIFECAAGIVKATSGLEQLCRGLHVSNIIVDLSSTSKRVPAAARVLDAVGVCLQGSAARLSSGRGACVFGIRVALVASL